MNNRILAMLLAIIMIIGIVPVNAFAAEKDCPDCDHVHDASCGYCGCANEAYHYIEGCTASYFKSPCTHDCDDGENNNTDDGNDGSSDTPVTPTVHTHVDKNGAVGGGSNGVCDISGCKEHVHQMLTIEAKAATCKETGISGTYYKCQTATCGKAYKDAEGTVEARESDYILNVVAHKNEENVADCLCDFGCGTYVHVLTHVAKTDPTCDARGVKEHYVCANNANHLFADAEATTTVAADSLGISKIAHDYEYAAKPYGENMHVATCKDCGKVVEEACSDTDDCVCDLCLALLLHTDDHVTTVPQTDPTCTMPGLSAHYVCVNEACGKRFVKGDGDYKYVPVEIADIATIDATGHAPSDHIYHDEDSHWQLCNNGCKEILNEAEHVPGDKIEYPSNHAQHYQICTVCGEGVNHTAHDFNYAAKEYGDDRHVETCKDCGSSYTVTCNDGNGDCKCDKCGAVVAEVHETGLKYVAKVDAKCEVAGVEAHYKCETCTTLFSGSTGARIVTADELEIDALKHSLSGWKSDGTAHWKECIRYGCSAELEYAEHTPGVCHEYPSDKSKHFQQCTVCVKSLNIEEHEYTYTSNGNGETHKAECKECGKIRETAGCYDKDKNCYCDACGGLVKHTLAPLSTVKQAPKCGIVGYEEHYKCNTCQNLFDINCNVITLESVTIPALQHKWWPKGKDLSGTLHTEQCEYCKVIRFLSHFDANGDCMCDYEGCTDAAHEHTVVHVAAKAATCVEEGNQEYWYFDECDKLFADEACTQPLTTIVIYGKVPHTEGKWESCEDGETHAKYCVNCDELLNTAEHDFSSEAPYCVGCGAAEGLEFMEEVPATCKANGMKAHYKSSITQRRYWDAAGVDYISNVEELVITKLSHDWVVDSTDGAEHVIKCDYNCGEAYEEACASTDGNCVCDICMVPMAGHSYEEVEYIAPTCEDEGQMHAVYCKVCKKFYDAETAEVLTTIVIPAMGHDWEDEWYNDVREGTHSKDCLRCHEKISVEHELSVESVNKGNLHEWSCAICEYVEYGIHSDKDGDSECDECGHDSNKVVSGSSLNNPVETIKIKGDKDDTVQEKKSNWWNSFVGKLNPSYVGESASSSAPSASVGSSNTSGTTSSGTVTPGTGAGSSSTGSSGVAAVVTFLMNLLNALLGR